MREIVTPREMDELSETDLLCWLARKTSGNILELGCKQGVRTEMIAEKNPGRIIYAVDWSLEHRVMSKDQKRPATPASMIGRNATRFERVKILNMDPATIPVTALQPIGMTVIDYDYSLEGLKRVSEPVLEAIPALGVPNTVIAWVGYQKRQDEEPNEVRRYLEAMDGGNAGNVYHFKGWDTAFRVYNPTPGLKAKLRELADI